MNHTWPPAFNNIFLGQDPVKSYFSLPNVSSVDCEGYKYTYGYPRCWTQCDDPEYALAEYVSLWECALVPNITSQSRSGTMSPTSHALLEHNDVDTSLSKASNITTMVSACLVGYCDALDHCKQNYFQNCAATALAIDGSMLNKDAMDSCIQSICKSHPPPYANADFAGIGIVMSYILGVGLSLLNALTLVILAFSQGTRARHDRRADTLDNNTFDAAVATPRRSSSRYKEIMGKAKGGKSICAAERLYIALLTALAEFLTGQCLLVTASSVAAIIWFNTQTIALLDGLALMTLCNAGIFSVTFTFYFLAVCNTPKSWFLYILTICTWILSFYATFSIQVQYDQRRSSKVHDNFLATGSYVRLPQACDLYPPFGICRDKRVSDLNPGYSYYSSLCLPVIAGLTIWQFSSTSCISVRMPRMYPQLSLITMHVSAVSLFIAPLFFCLKNIVALFAMQSIDTTWAFGQVVALTASGPFILALIINYARGFKETNNSELLSSYGLEPIV